MESRFAEVWTAMARAERGPDPVSPPSPPPSPPRLPPNPTAVSLLQVIPGQSFVLACRFCRASGRLPNALTEELEIQSFHERPCELCGGKGALRLRSPDLPVNCGGCFGTGRRIGVVRQCLTCQGLGILSLTGTIVRAEAAS